MFKSKSSKSAAQASRNDETKGNMPDDEWLVLANSKVVSFEEEDLVADADQKKNIQKEVSTEKDDDWSSGDETFGAEPVKKKVENNRFTIDPMVTLLYEMESRMESRSGGRLTTWAKVFVGFLLSVLLLGGDRQHQGGKFVSPSDDLHFEYDDLEMEKLRVELQGRLLVVQHLEEKVKALQRSNDRYSSDLALLAMDRSSWRSLAHQYEQELENAFKALEISAKHSKLFAPVVLAPASTPVGWKEAPHPPGIAASKRNNSQSEHPAGGAPGTTSYHALVIASSTALTNL